MDKSKLASLGERLKSGGAQMGRMVSLKMKEMKDLLQTPTPESRIVDQATSPNLESPDWGLNLRICSLINGEEVSSAEIVKAIKRKITGNGDAKAQRLALELLEACAMNCEKVFSEIASEKVVEEMVGRLIENPEADRECQVRAMELIRAWGESPDLSYLPVFRHTYEILKARGLRSQVDGGTFPPTQYSLESYMDDNSVSPPESYPIPDAESNGASGASLPYNYGGLSVEEKKEFLEITRNSLEVLSSLLSSAGETKVTEDDLTISMLDKCKESQPVVQRIVQSTADDEGLLFEALNLNDELQKVISKFEEMQVSVNPEMQQHDEPKESSSTDVQPSQLAEGVDLNPKDSSSIDAPSPQILEAVDAKKLTESPEGENTKPDAADLLDGSAESSSEKK